MEAGEREYLWDRLGPERREALDTLLRSLGDVMVEQAELPEEHRYERDVLAAEIRSADDHDADLGGRVWAALTPREQDFIAVMLGNFDSIRGAAVMEALKRSG